MREKQNYREMLGYLATEKGLPLLLTVKQVQETLEVSYGFVTKLIKSGRLKKTDGKITLGSLASYLCD